jgi:hypothetical protein
MAYKSFKGKWQSFGDKPIISILSTGLICFNKVCYETFVKPARPNAEGGQAGSPADRDKPTNCKYVKLYYEPETKKVAFEFRSEKKGDFVLPVNLTKTGLLAVVNGKTFFNQFGIKYPEQSRSFPVHQTSRYSRIKGIEIKLTEYFPDEKRI